MTRLPESAPGTARGLPADRPKRWRLVALGVALAIQLIVLYLPQAPAGPSITGLDKVVHLSIFFVPSLAALMMGIRARWALGILALHAPLSELIQHFALPQRSGDVFDAVADLSGVLLGGLAYLVWTRRHP
ncbi:MAG: VanZ family protein [Actinomycetota bacterium]